jgi:hypothetical protein
MFQGKTKKNKKIKSNKFSNKFSRSAGPMHSCRGRRLCCSLGGIEMFQQKIKKLKN